MEENEKTVPGNVTLYPIHWATAKQVAKDIGQRGESAGLRFIIEDWVRFKKQQNKGEK